MYAPALKEKKTKIKKGKTARHVTHAKGTVGGRFLVFITSLFSPSLACRGAGLQG